ncbi:4'-phosphopantetheinyl transferase [Pedobacter cryoconitis]|uniref:4'-phosphopantetheinyl transferase n=1 Tax=Pedobacter cryoconitis TaxID=188932 RepID=A0A127VA98_9SPHI|nr:4'-phosphopantetheinyl transferase family protein [Pedobacter cryoconitis]AMP97928.1 4'-phosphopantetheinyl transferase [Pedobacter cryoconitis]
MPITVEKIVLQRANGQFPAAIAIVSQTLSELKDNRYSFLHPNELNFFAAFKFERAQHSYLLGRFAAKSAWSAFAENFAENNVMTAVEVTAGIFQQPVLYLPDGGNVQLSIAHTEKIGMAIVYPEGHPMGIDVELINPEQSETIREVVGLREQGKLHLIHSDVHKSLTLLWTIKEALSKVLKTGLMTPFELFEVENIQHLEDIVICDFINFPQYKSLSWLAGGYAWSIVLPRKSKMDLAVIRKLYWPDLAAQVS